MNQDTNHQEVNATPHSDTKFSFRTGLKAGNMGDLMPPHPSTDNPHSNYHNCPARIKAMQMIGDYSLPVGCENAGSDLSMMGP